MVFDDNVAWCKVVMGNYLWSWIGIPITPIGIDKAMACLKGRKRRCSSFVRLYELQTDKRGELISRDHHYMLPNAQESLVSDMAELSITHTMVGIVVVKYGVGIALMESSDGTTNIDADFISELVYGSRR